MLPLVGALLLSFTFGSAGPAYDTSFAPLHFRVTSPAGTDCEKKSNFALNASRAAMAGAINMAPGVFGGPATSAVALQLLLPNALDDVKGCSTLRNTSFNGVKIKGKYLLILRGGCPFSQKVVLQSFSFSMFAVSARP